VDISDLECHIKRPGVKDDISKFGRILKRSKDLKRPTFTTSTPSCLLISPYILYHSTSHDISPISLIFSFITRYPLIPASISLYSLPSLISFLIQPNSSIYIRILISIKSLDIDNALKNIMQITTG